ncbi:MULTISPECIES: response regulator transcription factor [Eisenbergiella]|uniref:Stage 0 sporulation protein A homolog n=1 Tax=Eisenbergiella porci TaxID=2652274 RepID=A0A6N7VYP9_9FIRM|nr:MULTISPECIES: helix-turn-helix domain-containing protein [Eisenbergiella]MDY2654026.1 helix-turn-helix domain-containing protein [Eisenbergiella porci]MSS88146.1 response regulator transcription factor [Eisenbergiella porci]
MRILIVDDDILICKNVKSKLLRIAGREKFECTMAHSVVDAKIAIRECEPDVLITDLNMPGISGLSLISYVKKNYEGIRIYVLSGYDDYDLVRRAFLNGARDYLLKPVDIQELQEKILPVKDSPGNGTKSISGNTLQFDTVLSYIEEHLSTNLTMEEAAASIAMSYHYFSRRFREYTGYTFPEYINRRRIERAKSYLCDPSVKISDIAYKVGYDSASTFSKAFSKYEGCSPADFRNKQKISMD